MQSMKKTPLSAAKPLLRPPCTALETFTCVKPGAVSGAPGTVHEWGKKVAKHTKSLKVLFAVPITPQVPSSHDKIRDLGELALGRSLPVERRCFSPLDAEVERLYGLELVHHFLQSFDWLCSGHVQGDALGAFDQLLRRHPGYDEQVADDDLEILRPTHAQSRPELLHLLRVLISELQQ